MFALQCPPAIIEKAELHARDNTRMISPDDGLIPIDYQIFQIFGFIARNLGDGGSVLRITNLIYSDSLLYSIAACEKLTRRWLYPGRGTRAHCEPPEASKACFGFAQLQPSMVILTHTSIPASTTRSGIVLIYKVLPINLLAPPSSEHHAMINLSCVQIN